MANAESENFSSSTTSNSLYNTGNAYTMPRYNNNNTNSPVANMTGAYGDIYSYGNYYTWAAAIANTTAYGSSSDVINTSICPAGWHLPYGGSGTGTNGGNTSGGFYNLNYKINNNSNVTNATAGRNLRAYPNNFVYSGYFYSSSAGGRGSYGYYWSSTALHSSGGYLLRFNSSSVSPGTGDSNKYLGSSVRCVLGS